MRGALPTVLVLLVGTASAAEAAAASSDAAPCREEWSGLDWTGVASIEVSDAGVPAIADGIDAQHLNNLDSFRRMDAPDASVMQNAPSEADKPAGLLSLALSDAGHVLSAPIHWSLKEWGLAAASIGTVALLGELGDVHLRAAVQKNKSGVLDDLTKVVEPFGTSYGWAVVGAYGVVGFAFHDQEAKDIAFDAAMSALLSGGMTDGIKLIVGRARPEQNLGAAHFDPFGGDKSFPSGHATTAFAIGSVIAAHSDQAWVKVSAYSIASLVAFSRVYHDAHWTSDVAGGALIGTVVGETVVRFNRTIRARGAKVAVYAAPVIDQERRGAVLVVVF